MRMKNWGKKMRRIIHIPEQITDQIANHQDW
jgi:hypothetical protein